MESITISNSLGSKALKRKTYSNLFLILSLVSSDLAITLGTYAFLILNFPKASALTDYLPFYYFLNACFLANSLATSSSSSSSSSSEFSP